MGTDGKQLPEKSRGAGVAGLLYHDLHSDLRGSGGTDRERGQRTRRNLAVRRIYGIIVLLAVQNQFRIQVNFERALTIN